jgi:hypothetical protein
VNSRLAESESFGELRRRDTSGLNGNGFGTVNVRNHRWFIEFLRTSVKYSCRETFTVPCVPRAWLRYTLLDAPLRAADLHYMRAGSDEGAEGARIQECPNEFHGG